VIFSFNFHSLSTVHFFSPFFLCFFCIKLFNTSNQYLNGFSHGRGFTLQFSLFQFAPFNHYTTIFKFRTILLLFFTRFSPSILPLNPNSCLVLSCFRENREWAQLEPLWSVVLPNLAQAVYMYLFDFFFPVLFFVVPEMLYAFADFVCILSSGW